MKKLIIITAILITGFISSVNTEAKIINHPGFEFGFFYTNLAPYGTWMEIDGLTVWHPINMNRDWAPYRDGRWIWTSDGWYWDSYEPFGYIVFHYGRWYYDNYYGWLWIPDNEWAPAWVDWRYDNNYIGWTPLPPYAVFSINIGIHYTSDYYVPYYHWYFVRYKYFCDPYVYKYYAPVKYRHNIYRRTKYRNNYGYRNGRVVNNGVDINYVRERTNQNIRQRNIVAVSDYKEVEKYRGKDTGEIRTFIASRDELTRTEVKDVKIEKQNRRTSLDMTKVRLGKDNSEVKERNTGTVNEKEVIKDRNIKLEKLKNEKKDGIIYKGKTENNPEIRKENKSDVKLNKDAKVEKKKEYNIVPEKKLERKEVKKVELNVNRNSNEIRKPEVKRESTKKDKPVIQPRRSETKTEVKRNNTSISKPAPNKVERKSESDKTEKRKIR